MWWATRFRFATAGQSQRGSGSSWSRSSRAQGSAQSSQRNHLIYIGYPHHRRQQPARDTRARAQPGHTAQLRSRRTDFATIPAIAGTQYGRSPSSRFWRRYPRLSDRLAVRAARAVNATPPCRLRHFNVCDRCSHLADPATVRWLVYQTKLSRLQTWTRHVQLPIRQTAGRSSLAARWRVPLDPACEPQACCQGESSYAPIVIA